MKLRVEKHAERYFYSFIAVLSHLVQQVQGAETYSTQARDHKRKIDYIRPGNCVAFSFITIRGAIECFRAN